MLSFLTKKIYKKTIMRKLGLNYTGQKKIVVSFLVILTLYSCKKEGEERTNSYRTETTKELENISRKNNLETQHIIKDSLVFLWNTNLLEMSKSDVLITTSAEIINNNHSSWEIDTVKTMTLKQSKLTIYAGKKGHYGLLNADIQNSEIPISKRIRIGIDQGFFEGLVRTQITNDTINIGDAEQGSVFQFVFDNRKLKRILLEGAID